jgi:hypothetical protein
MMDSGIQTVNRSVVKNYLKLLRPTSERIQLIYVDFLDRFFDKLLVDVASGEITHNEDTGEITHAQDGTVTLPLDDYRDDWTNAWMMWQAKLDGTAVSDNKGRLLFYYQDSSNYMFVEIDMMDGTGIGQVKLGARKLGIDTIFDTVTDIQLDKDTYYTWRVLVQKFYDPEDSFVQKQRYRVFQDRSELIQYDETITASTIDEGPFGLRSYDAHFTVKEIELYQWPLDVEWVWPDLWIHPRVGSIAALGTIDFDGRGGSLPYSFSIEENNSGGSINGTTGEYTAGATTGVVDKIKITDSHDEEAFAYIDVT